MFDVKQAQIRDYVEKLAQMPRVTAFYANEISSNLGVTEEEAYNVLLKLTEEGIIRLRFEIRTIPELEKISVVDDYRKILNTTMDYQDEEYYIAEENVFPLFVVDSAYRHHVLEKNKIAYP